MMDATQLQAVIYAQAMWLRGDSGQRAYCTHRIGSLHLRIVVTRQDIVDLLGGA